MSDEPKSTEDYKLRIKKVKRVAIIVIGLSCLLSVFTVLLCNTYINENEYAYEKKKSEYENAIFNHSMVIKALKEKLQKLESIKTNDDFMVRDIELYIKTQFRRVPKIIARSMAETIVSVCREEEVSPELVVGIIQIESQFNPMARNEKSKAIGAMQIMPEWAKKLGLESVYDLYDIPTNIESGVKVLKIHIEEDAKGDIAQGLYFYVGKDSTYAAKVFQAAGKFAVFRSTINDDKNKKSEEDNEKEENENDADKPAETTNGQHPS